MYRTSQTGIHGASRRSGPIALAVLLAALLGAGVAVTDSVAGWNGKEVVRDGVKHVMNPKAPEQSPSTLELETHWRLGTEDDDEIFGVITDVIADDGGNFYFLDAQLNEIKVYSSDGEYLRTIGREGEGPGEFRGAFNMFRVPGGNIGVLQTFPSKIVMLTPDGEPAGEYPLPEIEDAGFRVLLGARYAGTHLAMTYALNQPAESGFTQTSILAFVDKDGKQETRLYDQAASMSVSEARISEKEWDTFRNRWTASADGRAFSAVNFGEYAINVWNTKGELERVIHRDYPEHVRSDEEKERLLDIYKGFTRRIPIPGIKYEIEDTFNQIQALYARDDGSLWVQTSRGTNGLDEGTIGKFDVFDKNGRFVRQVTLEGEGDPLNDGYFFVKDRLFVVTDFLAAMMALQGGGGSEEEEDLEDEPEPMQILSYRLR